MTARQLILWAMRTHCCEDLSAKEIMWVLTKHSHRTGKAGLTLSNVRVYLRVLEEDGFLSKLSDEECPARTLYRLSDAQLSATG